jgi:hypothetical protein
MLLRVNEIRKQEIRNRKQGPKDSLGEETRIKNKKQGFSYTHKYPGGVAHAA